MNKKIPAYEKDEGHLCGSDLGQGCSEGSLGSTSVGPLLIQQGLRWSSGPQPWPSPRLCCRSASADPDTRPLPWSPQACRAILGLRLPLVSGTSPALSPLLGSCGTISHLHEVPALPAMLSPMAAGLPPSWSHLPSLLPDV